MHMVCVHVWRVYVVICVCARVCMQSCSHVCVCICVYVVMSVCACVGVMCATVSIWRFENNSVVASLLLWASWTRSWGLDLSPTEPFHQPFVDYFYDYNLFKMSWHYERFLLVQEDSTSWLILGHRGGFQGRVSAIPLTLSLSFCCLGSQDSSDGSFLLALHPCLWLVDVLNLCIPARPGLSISQGHSS